MKYALLHVAALLVFIAGSCPAYAGDKAGGDRTGLIKHYSAIEGAYFSGSGFSSQPETYAAQEKSSGGEAAVVAEPKPAGFARWPHYAPEEYLYFTGTGLASGPAK